MLEGVFLIAAGLFLVSGTSKLIDPAPTAGALRTAGLPGGRGTAAAIGVVEILTAVTGAVFGGAGAWAMASVYLAFAAFVGWALARRVPIASCGCFGRPDTPPTWGHLGVNLVAGGVAVAVASRGIVPIDVLGAQPWAAVPYLGFVGLGVYLLYLLLTELPVTLSAGKAA